jgi:hypothetical protein
MRLTKLPGASGLVITRLDEGDNYLRLFLIRSPTAPSARDWIAVGSVEVLQLHRRIVIPTGAKPDPQRQVFVAGVGAEWRACPERAAGESNGDLFFLLSNAKLNFLVRFERSQK